ncbi:serine hydrolase [Streptococcus sp. E17BB]|uniref:serine hydrolase n=1 Tax=Streptococcus sp. E17BB TaxID=3278714 RepID=UPI00359E8617
MKYLKWLSLWVFPLLMTMTVSANDDLVKMAQDLGYPATSAIAPKGAIVIEADTGQIIWGHDIDLQSDPASTTKTMVIYLTMEAIKSGQISLDTEVVATETDQAISKIFELSNNKIVAGVTYTVRELLTMTVVPSSNVATLMLAHLIHDGTDASFIERMNATAQELGMTNTVFYNGTGADIISFKGYYAPEGYDPVRYNLTTVKDLAILARALLTKHPDILAFTNSAEVTVKSGTPYQETFKTYNHSLPGASLAFEGVDGLKTGSSPTAGYNAIVTAKQGERRLIAVVMGASKWGDPDGEHVRHYFVNTLLNHGFKDYEKKTVLPSGRQEIEGKPYQVQKPLVVTLKKASPQPTLVIDHQQATVAGIAGLTESIAVPIEEVISLSTENSSSSEPLIKKEADEWAAYLKVIALVIIVMIVVVLGLIIHEIKKHRHS